MLKRSTTLAWGGIFSIVSNLGILPLVWDPKRLRFYCRKHQGKLNVWRGIVLVHFSYVMFLSVRFFHAVMYTNREGYEIAFQLIWSTTFVISGLSHLNFLLSGGKIADYLNHLVWINLNWKKTCFANDRKTRWIFCGMLGSACCHVFIGIAALIWDPTQPQYLTSVIFPRVSKDYHLGILALAVVFECCLLVEHWINMITQAFIHLVYLYTSILCLREIREKLTDLPMYLKRYRMVQLLHSYYLEVASGEFLCGFEFVFLYGSVATNYSSIKFHSSESTPIHMYLIFPLCSALSIIYQYLMHSKASLVFKTSRKIYGAKKEEILDNPFLRRYQRSCRPMMVKVGPILRYKNLTPLKFFNFIMIWTMKMYIYTLK